ncbi:MAG TPA: helix-turn-helix transcriptional regulator [Rudaea sp.]|nr:helix-turn-helix transcriptional regulator [Rudaea sp.]
MVRTAISVHDSPLGRWTRALGVPEAPLAAHVAVFWYVAGRTTFARDRRLPTGRSHLLFNLGEPPTLFPRDSAAPHHFATCWLSGQQQSFIETGAQGATALVGIEFHAHGAYRLLRVAQHELADRVIELEALLGDRVLGVRERLLDAHSPQACFALLERWLVERLERAADAHPAVLECARRIAADPGRCTVAALGRHVGLSREHLSRRFREQVGLTPKAYANILRFERALALARHGSGAWSEIAADCGYYDQAHLIRDFQRYAGRTPASLLRDGRPDASSIVVGE